jgi:N-methylhydantoinase A
MNVQFQADSRTGERRLPFECIALVLQGGGARRHGAIGASGSMAGGRCKIWDSMSLPVGARLARPAVIEQNDATTVLDPGLAAEVDSLGNPLVTRA